MGLCRKNVSIGPNSKIPGSAFLAKALESPDINGDCDANIVFDMVCTVK